ncbi:RICIN domain-containing protein [Streptomyces sp. ICBB 8177]|uniref:RICIN domain-containing protein n=1 Tax=Streptomyces sp. ICBB 8177 TaxID=563922 RepID=UPI000D681812|nr:RICIN domain-containing protein [Streptomyces sp. ICBB 8177]PWI42150.1 hydrogenase expression protein [Streptomyces sp. ICBB 8177]
MSLWTSLEPASTTVDPGGSTTVRLRLRNTGDVVDEYRFEPVGEVAPWTTVTPPSIRLYPGTTGTVELTFAPPRTPDATAGPNPYAVRITPTEHPEATTVPEGNLTVTPFTELRAELVPPTVKGRFRGRPKLAVDNLGNTPLTASVTGSDNGDHLAYDIRPGSVQIAPGRAAFLKTTLRPHRIIWFGAKQQRPYTLAVQRSGARPHPVEGMYTQRGVLPRWLATALGMVVALAVAFAAFWFAHPPQVHTLATERVAQAAATALPGPSVTPSLAPPPSPSPSQSPDGGGGSAQAPGGGGGNKKPKPKNQRVLLMDGATGKCADLPGQGVGSIGGPVNQFTCDPTDSDNQLWNLDVVFPGKGPNGTDLFQIENVKDGYCMDLPGNGPDQATTHVSEYSCTRTIQDNQLWSLEKRPNGLYWIRNYMSNELCLDVSGHSSDGSDAANGQPLTIYNCSDNDDQGWRLVPGSA